jgi:hypothetical protein
MKCNPQQSMLSACRCKRTMDFGATILGSSMAFIDGTVVNVALTALQSAFHASLSDVQWGG